MTSPPDRLAAASSNESHSAPAARSDRTWRYTTNQSRGASSAAKSDQTVKLGFRNAFEMWPREVESSSESQNRDSWSLTGVHELHAVTGGSGLESSSPIGRITSEQWEGGGGHPPIGLSSERQWRSFKSPFESRHVCRLPAQRKDH